ncbi:MAG: type IV secretion protein Rhs, partial [Clostridiaceae bacterium]|nr:type IV secretion protein Rhs [Clostridiaceae bacterium]
MNIRYQSIIAFLLVVLMICNCIMSGANYAEILSDEKAELTSSHSVSETVLESVYEIPTNSITEDTSPETSLMPENETYQIPVIDTSDIGFEETEPDISEPGPPETEPEPEPPEPEPEPEPELQAQLPYELFNESILSLINSVVLPLEEGQTSENEKISVATAKILNPFFEYRDNQLGGEIKPFSITPFSDEPPEEIFITEGQVVVMNDGNSEEKGTYFEYQFIPESTSTYILTATKATLSSMYVDENEGRRIGDIRYWPEKNNSIACKLYKDQQYRITIYLNDPNVPSELTISKYISDTSRITYKIEDNTYTEESNASFVVSILNVPANILYGVIDRDILFSAEILKDGVSIDKLPEIPTECIRGLKGIPDDNVLQFVCNFNTLVEPGEYTFRIDCKDINGEPVLESSEAQVNVKDLTIYVQQGSSKVRGNYNKYVYFNNVNIREGRFVLFDGDKTLGLSEVSNVSEINISKLFSDSGYSVIDNQYDSNFKKLLYRGSVPEISCNDVLKTGSEYTLKFVTGTSEYSTYANIEVTDRLILERMYLSGSLYDLSSFVTVGAEFSGLKSLDADKIDVILTDVYGNTVASKEDYVYNYGNSGIMFRLKVETPVLENNKYYIKVSYPEGIISNAENVSVDAYQAYYRVSLNSVRVIDAKEGIVDLSTYYCDNSIEYTAKLYRLNGSLKIPISELSRQKPDENGIFTLRFSSQSGLPIFAEGSKYNIELTYDGISDFYNNKIDFSVPVKNSLKTSNIISFDPPALPLSGKLEFTINGYGIEDGIMGTDNENINIELVADNEIYGYMDKSTITKSMSLYQANGGDYSVVQVMIKGDLNITKELKENTKYYIRINGTEYEYFYNSSEFVLDTELCKIDNYYTQSSFGDLSGNEQICFNMYQNQSLELNLPWVRNVSPSAKLVLVNVKTQEEFEMGSFDTKTSHYDGLYRDISIKTQLSSLKVDEIYAIFFRDNETDISLGKFISIETSHVLNSFSVSQAVYGSDMVTLQFSGTALWDENTFNIKDAFDNIIEGERVEGSERKASIGNEILIDFKLDTPLEYGAYKFNIYRKSSSPIVVKYEITEENSSPSVTNIQAGFPYLVHGKNLSEDTVYTADIMDMNNAVHIKKGVTLIKRTGENILEISEESVAGLPL